MENDNDVSTSNFLYPTLHATRIIDKLFEQLGIMPCALDDTVRGTGQGLHHHSWMVRLEAVRSLSVLGKQAEPVLMRMIHDENECVRLLAQYELQRLALMESSPSIPVEYRPPEVSSRSEVHSLEQLSCEKVQAKVSEKQKRSCTITWREMLEILLEETYALEKVKNLLHVSHETIMNWIHYRTDPDFRIFQQILEAFPDDYDALLELIQREFPDFIPERLADDEELLEILEPFHDRLSKTLHESPPMFRLWSTCQLVLQQAMQQLDPYRTGMMMAIIICTPPSAGNKVRSLHGYLGLGSSVWTGNWYQQPLFFGSDSLSGYAATTGTIQVIHDVKSNLKGISFYDVDDIRSVLVVPILSFGRCAGCLYVANTSPYYFCSRRIKLVQEYTECLAHVFSPEEFYTSEQMQLLLFPYKTHLAYFNKSRKYIKNNSMPVPIKIQYKRNDWKCIEEDLIHFIREQQESAKKLFSPHRPIVDLGIPQARPQIEAELFALLSTISWSERWQDLLA